MIRIDAREKDLIGYIRGKFSEEKISIESLAVGDCIIEKSESEKIIIERKTLYDLISSIKDGRYAEQSYRLNGSEVHNHNIIYLIEGDISRIKSDVERQTIYSAIFSLSYFKGFSTFRTINTNETATYICNCAIKMFQKDQKGHYSDVEGSSITEVPYSSVVKQVKKENITPENIGEIMLCQIPGVSAITALAIIKHFKYFTDLIAELQEKGEECLKDVSWTNAKGQVKKISKPACSNIKKYLLCE